MPQRGPQKGAFRRFIYFLKIADEKLIAAFGDLPAHNQSSSRLRRCHWSQKERHYGVPVRYGRVDCCWLKVTERRASAVEFSSVRPELARCPLRDRPHVQQLKLIAPEYSRNARLQPAPPVPEANTLLRSGVYGAGRTCATNQRDHL